jgi:ribosomal protein L37AE/L43A
MIEQTADQKTTQQELGALKFRINTEVGTEDPCPWCGTPRVTRSSYIRCNPCGTNWFKGADLSKDPRVRMVSSVSSPAKTTEGVVE